MKKLHSVIIDESEDEEEFLSMNNNRTSFRKKGYGSVNDEESETAPLMADYSEDGKKSQVPSSLIGQLFHDKRRVKCILCFIFALILATIVLSIPKIFEDDPPARRCLALFLFVATLWATEAIPLYATSILIPILIVTFRVLKKNGQVLDASDSSKEVMGTLFTGTVLVALGAFTMSLALTKYNLSYRLGSFVLRKAGTRPPVVLLAVMFLGLFLSMWMNNVASPVVIVSVVRPLLDELPTTETYAKVLLLGIAYSNNIGGMTTPISSPQNLVAINTINSKSWNVTESNGNVKTVTGSIGWGQFLGVSLPFSIGCTLIVFAFLWLVFRPKLKEVAPIPPKELEPFSIKHVFILLVCGLTITLWALQHQVQGFFGNVGIIALIPVVTFFTMPILEKSDFKELSWDVLMLLGGGIALGDAIQSSGLLSIMANALGNFVEGSNIWVTLLAFAGFIWIFGNFISHTVAAIIVLPVIASVGCRLGNGNCDIGHYDLLVLGAVFMDSGAMGLPVTSFPNAQCFSIKDRNGEQYLSAFDFVKTGFVLGILEVIFLMTGGYGLLQAIF